MIKARRLLGAAAVVTAFTAAALLGSTSLASAQQEDQVTLSASGSGDEEIPAGTGEKGTDLTASFQLSAAGQLTYTVSVTGNDEEISAGHIHQGAKGKNGPVVVELDAAALNDGTSATAEMDAAVAERIIANPENYYVNTHSESFQPPTGVARGQLTGDPDEPDLIDTGTGGQAAATDSLSAMLLVGAGLVAATGATLLVRRRRGGSAQH